MVGNGFAFECKVSNTTGGASICVTFGEKRLPTEQGMFYGDELVLSAQTPHAICLSALEALEAE